MRYVAAGLAVVIIIVLLAGCGGGGGGGAPKSTVTVNVTWPERSADKLVPYASESIKVEVFTGGKLTASGLMVRPASPPLTTSLTLHVFGANRALVRMQAFPNPDGTGVMQAEGQLPIRIPGNGAAYPASGQEGDPIVVTMQSTIDHVLVSPNPGSV